MLSLSEGKVHHGYDYYYHVEFSASLISIVHVRAIMTYNL